MCVRVWVRRVGSGMCRNSFKLREACNSRKHQRKEKKYIIQRSSFDLLQFRKFQDNQSGLKTVPNLKLFSLLKNLKINLYDEAYF